MKIKLLISYHDEHRLLKSDMLVPIQTGCAHAPKLFEGMLRDDIGENISADNDRYCELSAQYWAWKNYEKLGEPDYIGFMHYRRHFMFDGWTGNPEWCWLPGGNVYYVPCITPQYAEHLSREHIEQALEGCDVIVLKPYDVQQLNSDNVRAQYLKLTGQREEVFDSFIRTAKELYPDYAGAIEKIEHGSVQYLCNMFVMKKELFMEYNEFCFSILKAVDAQVDTTGMNEQALRFLGYLGEFCLSLFIFRLIEKGEHKIKELNGSYILSDEPVANPKKAYWYYWFMSKITFGRRRKMYKQKRRTFKLLMQFHQ